MRLATKQETNKKILKMLEGYVETYPDMRFQQIDRKSTRLNSSHT